MAWSEISGTKVGANIYPIGNFPSHHAIFGRGGYKTVANEAERLAIPIDRLTVGSVVRQHDTGEEWVVTALPQGTINSDYHTGKDCEWTVKDSISTVDLSNKADLEQDEESGVKKVKTSQSRAIIYRGSYNVAEDAFYSTLTPDKKYVKRNNAIYIDDVSGDIYICKDNKFMKNTIYWQKVD